MSLIRRAETGITRYAMITATSTLNIIGAGARTLAPVCQKTLRKVSQWVGKKIAPEQECGSHDNTIEADNGKTPEREWGSTPQENKFNHDHDRCPENENEFEPRENEQDTGLSLSVIGPLTSLLWLNQLPFDPMWIGIVGFPPVALLAFWLVYGDVVMKIYAHLGPEHSIRQSITTTAYGALTSLREGVLSIPGVKARHIADALQDGNWVLLMDTVEQDERHTNENPIQMERNESMLFAGATKAGKSSTMKTVLHQHEFANDEAVVAFDYKTEWHDYFKSRDDVNVVRVSPNPSRSTVTWNIFEELETEDDAMNVADDITKGIDGGEFFAEAGTQLLEGIMRVLIRRRIPDNNYDDAVIAARERNIPLPTNKDLVDYLQQNTPEAMWAELSEHDDLTGVASFIHPESKKQAIGVIASMQVSVRKMFAREFGKAGSFSIREYMEEPRGTVVVLDLPEKQKETTKPMFRMLIDRAAAHANTKEEPAMFLLDEFASLPKIENMDRLVNAGRSYNTQVLGAVQSVSQVLDTYGDKMGKSILEGFTQKVLMRSEEETRDYVQDVLGPDVKEKTVPVLNDDGERVGSDVQRVEQFPFTKREIMNWRQGDEVKAVAKTADGGWVFGTLRHPDEVCELVDEARSHMNRRE